MNKIAEDIIFLKDNLDLMDNRTYESLKAKGKAETKKKQEKKRRRIIISLIVAALFYVFMEKYDYILSNFLHYYIDEESRDASLVGVSILSVLIFNIGHPVLYIISYRLQYFMLYLIRWTIFRPEFIPSYPNSYSEAVIRVLITGILASLFVRIVYAFLKLICRIKKKSSALSPEEEDETTKKLYQIKERYDIPDYLYSSDWRKIFNYSNTDREIVFMRDFERLEKVQYPPVKIPQEKKIDRNILIKDLLESPLLKSIVNQVKGSEKERVSQLLFNEENNLYVDNDYREWYLKIVCELLRKIPKFKFNVDEVSRLGEPMLIREYWDDWDKRTYHDYIKYPKFNAVIRPFTQSNVCRNIENLNRIYEMNLKEFNNDLKGTLIGAEGEREVLKTLTDFAEIGGKDRIRILPNIRLEPNGKSVESDFIVVCPNGVFALEVKNLGSTGSYNITVEKDGLWKKVMKNGRWKQMPDSISRQNERHLMGIEQVINSKMGNSTENWIETKSLIVFANNVVGIRNYSNNVIIRDSEIMTEIRKHPICLNEQQINQIAEILLAESLPAKKYKMKNWMNQLVGVHLELVQRTQDIYPYLQEYIEIMKAYNYRIGTEIPLPSYQVVKEDLSLADDDSEYQKSSEEIEQENRAEQERQMEEERRIRERAENYINNNQSVYEDQSYEQRYFDYDAYMKGEIHSVYSED